LIPGLGGQQPGQRPGDRNPNTLSVNPGKPEEK
jgi:hypothetical protein